MPLKQRFSDLFVMPTDKAGYQFVRYGFVAAVAFTFDFGLLFVFTHYAGMFYLLSATLSFTLSAVVNYYLSTLWVFSNRVQRQRTHELAIFMAICLVALLLNDVFMWLFTSVFGIFYLVSKILTVCIVFFWSFGARRFFFTQKLSAVVERYLSRS